MLESLQTLETVATMSQASWPKDVLELGREGVEKRSKLVPRQRQLLDIVGVLVSSHVPAIASYDSVLLEAPSEFESMSRINKSN